MEVPFSPSPSKTLPLISFAPLCLSPHPSSSSSSRLCSVRGSLLCCRHNLRLPGLQSRSKCSRLGFQVHPSRLLVRASTSLQVVSDAAVFTSALILLSLPYLVPGRRNRDVVQELNFPKLSLFQLATRMLDQIIEDWIGVVGDLVKQISREGKSCSLDRLGEICDARETLKTFIQFQKSDLTCEGSPKVNFLESDSPDLASNGSCLEVSEDIGLSVVRPVFSASNVAQSLMPTDICGFQKGVCRKKTEHESVLSNVPFLANMSHTEELDKHKNSNYACCGENEVTSFTSFFADSANSGIHCVYDLNQPVELSLTNLNGRGKVSCHAPLLDSSNFSSFAGGTVRKGVDLLSRDSRNATALCGCLFGKRKELGNDWGFANKIGKSFVRQSSHNTMVQVPSVNGVQSNNKQNPSKQFRSSYKTSLRDGRLNDCIELLEAMERVGLLDMNKVYHTKFFDHCKSQKAVKEAFRFTKLIRNPTLSTYNMLMSVCASSQDFEGAFQVLELLREVGLKPDCKLYTTLISTCAKSGKVDAMFEVFHEMVNTNVEPNIHTYGALIDGCARAGQVAKAFGAYGIMRSKKLKPDRVVFNALITACGQAGAVDRAFDVLAEMRAETQPIDPDHITVGALIKACANAGRVDRALEVYQMIHEYHIKGTPEVYTIALNSCSQRGDWESACNIYNDMISKGVVPDEMFLSALMDVAGHAGKVDAAFSVLHEARIKGQHLGAVAYSSLMGACSNAKSWEKAVELYEDIKSMNLNMTVSAMNALITALCNADQLQKAMEVLSEMKGVGLCPNSITYSILFVASERKNDLEAGLMLFSQAKEDGVAPSLVTCRCLIGMCLRRFKKACDLGEPVLSFNSGRPQLDNKWTGIALMVYRETILAGVVPSTKVLSQMLGCLQLPHDSCLKNRLIENLGLRSDTSKYSNLCSLVDGFGEYDPCAFSLLEEAASLGIVPCVSLKKSPIVVDARNLQVHISEVYLLTVLKGLKHRLAAGAKLPNITILLPTKKTQIQCSKDVKTINLSGRINRAIGALLRRLGIPFLGSESCGKIRIGGLYIKRWFLPKLAPPFTGRPDELGWPRARLGKGISYQQRDIRTGNLSLD